jgi:predicted ester cyclase
MFGPPPAWGPRNRGPSLAGMDQRLSEREAADAYERQFGEFEQRLDESFQAWRSAGDRLRTFGRKWVLEGYVQRDVDVLVSMVTEDFTNEDPLNFGGTVHGPVEFRRMLEDTFRAFPDSMFVGDSAPFLGMEPDTIVVPWRVVGTFSGPLAWGQPGSRRHLTPTGRGFDFTGVDMYTLRGERVSAMRSLYDPIQVAQQLGLVPSADNLWMRLAPWPQAVVARALRAFAR